MCYRTLALGDLTERYREWIAGLKNRDPETIPGLQVQA
jgi:hypothetical protein